MSSRKSSRKRQRLEEVTEGLRKSPYSPFPDKNSVLFVMRDCVLTHRWTEALNLLRIILMDSRLKPDVVFKYTMLVLEHCKPKDKTFSEYFKLILFPHFILKFLRIEQKGLNRREVILETIVLLLRHDCLQEAVDIIDDRSGRKSAVARNFIRLDKDYWTELSPGEKRTTRSRAAKVPDDKYLFPSTSIDSLLVAYSAYKHFLKFKSCVPVKENEIEYEVGVIAFQELSACISRDYDYTLSMFFYCLVLINEKNNHEHEDDLISLLISYRKRNSQDLSTHLHLYNLLDSRREQDIVSDDEEKQREEKQEMKNCFDAICELSPGDVTVRNVCIARQFSQSNRKKCLHDISLLMDFLDYKMNMFDTKAWNCLFQKISLLNSTDKETFRLFKEDFGKRMKDYWLDVHFSEDQMSTSDSLSKKMLQVNHLKSNLLNLLQYQLPRS